MGQIDFSNPVGHLYAWACKHLEAIGEDPGLATKLVDIACAQDAAIISERDRANSRRAHTEYWYASRIETLTVLAKEKGIWPEVAAIIANGTVSASDPPTYARQLNMTKYRAEEAERRLQDAQQEIARLRAKLSNA